MTECTVILDTQVYVAWLIPATDPKEEELRAQAEVIIQRLTKELKPEFEKMLYAKIKEYRESL